MSEIFMVSTVLNFVDGSVQRIRMQAFETQETAERTAAEVGTGVKDMIEHGVVMVPEGPNGKNVSPMTVAQFCASLGISGVGHSISKVPVHGAVLLAAQPLIRLS
jgi:hypothetical protein